MNGLRSAGPTGPPTQQTSPSTPTGGPLIGSKDTILESELHTEQAHVDLCYVALAGLRARAEAGLQGSIELKTSTPQSVFEREVFASYSRKRLHAVSISEHQLVFGRLDLQEHQDPVYVGRIGLADGDQERILVDWRAPVGSAFYRATARNPQGVIRRRTLITRARKVSGMNDDLLIPTEAGHLQVVAGEGALLNALVRERGEFMQDIVATIQGEQDEVIRTEPKASILLTGGPGTGKSVVALHRTAYLMYERATELERLGVLVVGPGQRFSRYISRVLPSLGETSVNIRSVFDLTAPIVAAGREPLGVARIKGDAAMSSILKNFLIDSYPMPSRDLRVRVSGRTVVVEPARLKLLRNQVLSGRVNGFNSAGVHLWRGLARHILSRMGRNNPGKGEIAALVDSMSDNSETEELVDSLLVPRSGLQAWRQLTTMPKAIRQDLLEHFSAAEAQSLITDLAGAREPRVGDLALIDELSWLLGPEEAQPSEEPVREADYAEVTTAQDRLDAARPREASGAKDRGYGHIVVDEAQDLTAMQWRMLARRGEDATWTIVGDPSQATLAAPDEMLRSVNKLPGGSRLHRFTLGINYRTPRQIIEYASRVSGVSLGNLRSIRSGPEPVFFQYRQSPTRALARAVSWLKDQAGLGCIIVLDQADLQVVEAGGFEVIWALDAKGLEFDNVVLYRPESIDAARPPDASLLLIGATRATKGLAVVTDRP